MESKATLRFAKISPRKARVVADMIRGKSVAEAVYSLKFARRAASPIIGKLLDSAIANARNKDDSVDLDSLFIQTIFADKAPDSYMRRWRPRAMGRATRIVKGSSHITLVLANGDS